MKEHFNVIRKTVSKDVGTKGTIICVFVFISCFLSLIGIICGLNMVYIDEMKDIKLAKKMSLNKSTNRSEITNIKQKDNMGMSRMGYSNYENDLTYNREIELQYK